MILTDPVGKVGKIQMGCVQRQRYNKIVKVCFKSDRAKEKKLWKKNRKNLLCGR